MIEIVWLWPILLVAAGAACRLLARRKDRRRAAKWVALGVSLAALAGFMGALWSMARLHVDERIQEWPLGAWGLLPGAPLNLSLRYDALAALFGLITSLTLAAAQVGAANQVDGGEGRLLFVGGAALALLLAGDLASLLILSAALSCLSWATFRVEAEGRMAVLAACLVETMLILTLVSAVALTKNDGSFAALEHLITQEAPSKHPTAWIISGMLLLAALARLGHGTAILSAPPPPEEKETESDALWLGAILVASALYLLSRAQGALLQSPTLLLILRYVGAAAMTLGAAALLVSPRMGQAIAGLTVSGVGAILAATALGALLAATEPDRGASDLVVYQSVLLALIVSGWAAWVAWARHYGPDPWALSELARKDAWLAVAFALLALVMWAAPPLGGYYGQGRVLIEAVRLERWELVAAGLIVTLIIVFYCGRLFMAALLPRIGSSNGSHKGERAPARLALPALALAATAALGGVWAGALHRWLMSWRKANTLLPLPSLSNPPWPPWLWLVGFFVSIVVGLPLAAWVDHRAANKWEHDHVFMERPHSLREHFAGVAWLVGPRMPRRRSQSWPCAAVAALTLAALLYYLMVR